MAEVDDSWEGLGWSDEKIENLIRSVFNDDLINPSTGLINDLPEDLYYAIADKLKEGLYEGFGGTVIDFEGDSAELLESLRSYIYMFSGAKTFNQVLEMNDALADPDGGVRSWQDFKQAAADIHALYNGGDYLQDEMKEGYLRTEYDTTIASGQQAYLWQQIEDDKDALPYLIMSVVEDANTSDICEPLDGICLPVDDPFWDEYYPPNHFNCRSTVSQTDDESRVSAPDKVGDARKQADEDMQDEFRNNVGKTGEIFTPDHGYFSVPREYEEAARANFGLSIPETDE